MIQGRGDTAGRGGFAVYTGTATTPRFSILAGGNVGIGTTAPATKLHVAGTELRIEETAGAFLTLKSSDTSTSWIQFTDTAGGAGGLSYNHLTNAFGIKTNGTADRLVVSSAGYVGIGTTSPSTPLHVDSGGSALPIITLSASGASVNGIGRASAYFSGAASTDLGIKMSGSLFIGSANPASMVVTQAGLVGIGTTTPSTNLSVQGNGLFSGNLSVAGLTATGTISLPNNSITNAMLANSSITVSNGGGLTVSGSPVSLGGTVTVSLNTANANTWTALQQFNGNASTTQLTTTGNTYLASAGGVVALGTTSPQTSFQPKFQIDAASAGGVGLAVYNSSSASFLSNTRLTLSGTYAGTGGYIENVSGNLNLNASSGSGAMTFLIGAGEKARIDGTTGNLGIGTTTPSQRLSVQGNALVSGNLSLANLTATGTAAINTLTLTNALAGSYGGTGSTTLSGILAGNGTSGVKTAVIGSGLSWDGTTLTATAGGSGTVGSGTTGQFPYYAANGTTISATSSLFLAPTGFVGIGTTS
ncbi:MAG: hypothetical protein EKK59_09125, partial [Neisseriaceae bacterium]